MGSLSAAKKPVNHSHAALSLKLWQSVCLHQSECRGVLMSVDQDKEEYIWRGGGGNPGNQDAVRQWVSWCAGPITDRISHVLLSRKYLQKIWLLVRSSSSPACVEIQIPGIYGFYTARQGAGTHDWPSAGPWPQRSVFGLCQMSQKCSSQTESCICPPLTDPTTVQPVWPQQEIHWNQTCDPFCPPHPIYCTKAKC